MKQFPYNLLSLLFFTIITGHVLAASGLPELRTGDLIFQVEGKSDFSNAITAATAVEDSLKFIHVGIIEKKGNGNIDVIEASPEEGVRIVTLDKFLNDAIRINGNPGAVVKRLSVDFSVETAISNALQHIGEPYDWWYLPDNGKMYCSELIYESYMTKNGERIFHSRPMNFRAPDGTMPEFWINLFEKLGTEVPEGIDGTNPSDLSKEPVLIEVCRFF